MDDSLDTQVNAQLDTGNTDVSTGSSIASLEKGKLPDTPEHVIEEYMNTLKANQKRWAQDYPLEKKIKLLEKVLDNIDKVSDDWIRLDMQARSIPVGHPEEGFSAITPMFCKSFVSGTIGTLYKLLEHKGEKPFTTGRQDGDRAIVDSFPLYDEQKAALPGVRGEIWLEKGTKIEDLPKYQAVRYKDESYEGSVTLVLAAGNASLLAVDDFLDEMFVNNNVIVIKSNPVLEYMGGILETILEPFIDEGFVRVVVGGAKEGRILSSHPLVDNIHLTGSDKTFEAIVYGPGEEGQKNKAKDHRITDKKVTAELGNVSPVIVVPGEWSEDDFDRQAESLLSMLMGLNGYACLAMRVLVLPKNWDGSQKLLDKLKNLMSQSPKAVNYYPGTDNTLKEAMTCYPNATVFGEHTEETQPIVLVEGLEFSEEQKNEKAFKHEFWATFTSQAYVDEDDKHEYLRKAVDFVNKNLWGTLSAAIIVDPESEKELESKGSLKKAIGDLRYGTVAINTGTATSFMACNPWGGFPGSTYDDIQSGNHFENNPLLLSRIEKSVAYKAFRDEE